MQNERRVAYETAREFTGKEQQRQKRDHDLILRQIKVKGGGRVWLHNYIVKKGTSKKFHQPWKGPFDVCQVVGENNVDLAVGRVSK